MISALLIMCAIHHGACQTTSAHRIADAIDAVTDSEELRAVLSVYAFAESGFQEHPAPVSWDARVGLAVGPWSMWNVTSDTPLTVQAHRWLWACERGGLAALDSSPKRAYHRAHYAQIVLDRVRGQV